MRTGKPIVRVRGGRNGLWLSGYFCTMSFAGSQDSQSPSLDAFRVAGNAPASRDSAPGNAIDPLLIQQTKNEIRLLVQEIAQLSRSTIPANQFYEEFLRLRLAPAASGGAIWLSGDDGQLSLEYQVNLPDECIEQSEATVARHRGLLQNVLASGQATLVPPRSGSVRDEEAGNPTDSLLVLAALKVDHRPCGVIEVFQRSGGGPTTQTAGTCGFSCRCPTWPASSFATPACVNSTIGSLTGSNLTGSCAMRIVISIRNPSPTPWPTRADG